MSKNRTNSISYNETPRENSLWKEGKEQYKKFMNIKLKRMTSALSFIFGILLTAVIVLPVVWVIFEIIEIYWYNINTVYIFLILCWVLFMFCNGLSNYITIKIVKAVETDMTDIQSIDDKAVFFYQSLNFGFGLFILLVLVFFFIGAMS